MRMCMDMKNFRYHFQPDLLNCTDYLIKINFDGDIIKLFMY